jgi:two-component SAPR family response regulator
MLLIFLRYDIEYSIRRSIVKVSVYDSNFESIEHLTSVLKNIPTVKDLNLTTSYDKFLNDFEQNSYDLIFLDTNSKNGMELKNKVKQINPNQTIVYINNTLHCFDDESCQECSNKRITKPYNITKILRTIQSEECEFKYNPDCIDTTLHTLISQYPQMKYCNIKKQITQPNGFCSINSYTNFIQMIETMKEYQLPFTVDGNKIQIHR